MARVSRSKITEYLSAGCELTLLDGKRPILKDWTNNRVSEGSIMAHRGNLGMVINEYQLVVDVDPKNGGAASFEKLTAHSDGSLKMTVNTPSGGFHVYLSIPESYHRVKLRKTLKEYPGIDFLSKGSQCVIAGSSTEKGRYRWANGGFHKDEAPDWLMEIITDKNTSVISHTENDDDLGDFAGLIGNNVIPRDDVEALLDKIDNDIENAEWVRVGMALYDWHPTNGLELWENWSVGGETYKEGECKKRWRSFGGRNSSITMGTLVHMAREVDVVEAISLRSDLVAEIKTATEEALKLDIFKRIRNADFSNADREVLAVAAQARLKELTGAKPKIKDVRAEVQQVVSGSFVDNQTCPEWCKQWVYVNSHKGYVKKQKLTLLKSEAFNLENGHYIPANDAGNKVAATKYVADHSFITRLDRMNYLPMFDDEIVTIDGDTVLNSFNPNTIPVAAEGYSEDGLKTIEMIKKHIRFICGTKKNARILTEWLCHQVQYPGKQVLWSPVIQSIEGAGKSFFGTLLRQGLGNANVGTIAPAQVTSQFNEWATNRCVNVLEELRVQGHNRYEALNAVKPLITDEVIQVNEKGVTPYQTINTANYICFTNFKDALPLNATDRRWWVIFVDIETLADIEKKVGLPAKEYFPPLFDAVREHGSEVRKWMLDFEISDDFMSTQQAPMTEFKQLMISTEDASLEGYTEAQEMVKKGGKYYNETCVSSSDLFEEMMFEYSDLDIQGSRRNQIMKKLGFQKVQVRVKIGGSAKTIWVTRPMSNSEIRESFE